MMKDEEVEGMKLKNVDILEDLYLQYEDMQKALERYLEIFNLKVVDNNNQ